MLADSVVTMAARLTAEELEEGEGEVDWTDMRGLKRRTLCRL